MTGREFKPKEEDLLLNMIDMTNIMSNVLSKYRFLVEMLEIPSGVTLARWLRLNPVSRKMAWKWAYCNTSTAYICLYGYCSSLIRTVSP